MSTAFEERFRKLGSPFNGAPPQNGLRAGRKARIRNDYSGSQLLTDLLGAVPVDLARISEHIRSHPEIADLIIRLAASLLLSADSSITIEDAAVMLGTDRLNVLASMWSIMEKYDEGGRAEKSPDLAARSADNPRTFCIHGTNWTAQSLYLATFLRSLGLDSPDSELPRDRMESAGPTWQAEDFADLRNLLMRDFLALLPTLNPFSSKADCANTAGEA
ncbi:MAG TPA: hypothetical protein VIY66_02160 [Candidatus Acidoferrales bacterium]